MSGGALSLSGSIDNISDFTYGEPLKIQAEGELLVNGTSKSSVTIDSSTGDLSLASVVTISGGEEVVLILQAPKTIAATKTSFGKVMTWVQSEFQWSVPVGGVGTATFTARIPPQATDNLGWGPAGGGVGKFTWERRYSAAGDGLNATLVTRLYDTTPAHHASKTLDPNSSATQPLVGGFNKADATGEQVEAVLTQPLGGGQTVIFGLLFTDPNAIPALSGALPAAALLTQKNSGGVLSIEG